MAFLFRGYIRLLQNHTLVTQMATGGVTSGLGSMLQQHAFEKRSWHEHEWYRTRRLVFYGTCCFAPFANRWHALLNRINVGGRWTTIGTRAVADAAIFAPFATSLFYVCQGAMEQRPWRSTADIQGIRERLADRLWGTVQKQWCVFGPVQVVNLAWVPVYARPPILNMVAIGWNCFLAGAQNAGAIQPLEGQLKGLGSAIIAVEVME